MVAISQDSGWRSSSTTLQDKTILVIDDDEQILRLVATLLEQENAHVVTAADGETALRRFYRHQPDLVIVDMMMPVMSGWELVRRIRDLSDVPIIMLTAVQGDQETVRALTIGCDDYITKPFIPSVLIARVSVLLRRGEGEHESPLATVYSDGYLAIDVEGQCARVAGVPIQLTPMEFRLLQILVGYTGKVCSFAQIIDHLWPDGVGGSEAAVHTYVWQLRQKLEPNPHEPQYLVGLRARGYRFDPQAGDAFHR
jgi:DNA-binding response OmpR family regulator